MSSDFVERLVPLDRSNWLAAAQVRVTDKQLPMVAHHQPVALEVLAKAYIQPEDQAWEPLGFVGADGSIIAVLALTHSHNVAEVRNFAVDFRHQRVGIGMKVMRSVIEWCRQAGASTVQLTFHPDNEAAARLYHRVGLRPTGDTRGSEPVWSIELD